MTPTFTNLTNIITVSGSVTATLNATHINTATATYTDPTPVEGRGFEVIVRNGTATVGGTAYAAGTIIWRIYHSGAWKSYPAPASYDADHTLTVVTPTSGSSITVPDDVSSYLLTPAATLATLTITFPANPYTRQMLTIFAGSFGVTALTLSANTGKSFATGAAITTIAASGFAKYLFNANVWYRVG